MCHELPIPICIAVGCPVKVSSRSSDAPARQCPKCHNGSVYAANRRRWIEICFVPLLPFSSKQIWHCNICNWQVDLADNGFQPAIASTNPAPPGPSQMMIPAQMKMIPPMGFAPPEGPPPANLQYPGGYGR
ncbi:hypothetical protein PCANC_13667 [Puccinia coronata f. sp. avenae]|uniref:Zinc-ribbon 15 domain-containing protein n=1 Tax=Puccinia coronata f. sp. avenae TaxID=200324 RepID=A0A2N5TDT3_9BASI|nr:hypothetical protein PCASD_13567 [Puccinia coronata f. sp. avenae]PLW38385.1 hypothetical protein PCANC_13667 [Puccinia coronata f. sp. avenae]